MPKSLSSIAIVRKATASAVNPEKRRPSQTGVKSGLRRDGGVLPGQNLSLTSRNNRDPTDPLDKVRKP
jgi:hypothetical protein